MTTTPPDSVRTYPPHAALIADQFTPHWRTVDLAAQHLSAIDVTTMAAVQDLAAQNTARGTELDRLRAQIARTQDVLKATRAAAAVDQPTCLSCGHLESAHDPAGDRDCHASGATVCECTCTWFIACYPAPPFADGPAWADPACKACRGRGTVEVPDVGGESASTEYCHCWQPDQQTNPAADATQEG
jgi:hypothetical protein